jgi:hypothetical protein
MKVVRRDPVAATLIQALFRFQRRQANALFGLSTVGDAQPAAISFLQRFDSPIRLNPQGTMQKTISSSSGSGAL